MERFTNLRVILGKRGHANLLCIVPILVYVRPKHVQYWRRDTCAYIGDISYFENHLTCNFAYSKELLMHRFWCH